MKRLIDILVVLLFIGSAQLRAQCLQLEGILADACNASGQFSEPYNEMVRFKTGGTSLPIAQLSIAGKGNTGSFNLNKWPNPTQLWHGLVQNANTASKVSAINASIQACGFVKEPPAGVIPPNSEVIMVCSQYMNPTSNSFANLNDTIYMVFQDTVSSATQGHFANYNATPGTRTLVLIDNSTGCTDTAAYDVSLLSGHTDGDAIEYDTAGNATYVNYGCQAPYVPLTIDAGNDQTICFNDSAVLTATPTGLYSSLQWSLANTSYGTLNAPTALTTTFVPSGSAVSPVKIYVTLNTVCGTSVKDSMLVNLTPAPTPVITANQNGNSICNGSPIVLSVTQQTGTTYSWNPGSGTGTSFTVSPSSQTIYTVTATNNCAATTASFTVNVNALPAVAVVNDTICAGGTGTLTATGASTYTWNTGATTPTISGSLGATAQFTVTGTDANGCVNTATALIYVYSLPVVTVNSASICPGATATLTAAGATNYTWSTSQNGSTITVSPPSSTSYIVKGEDANGCQNTTTANVTVYNLPNITTTNPGVCPGGTATITASGANTYTWSTSQNGSSITVSPGSATSYTVTGTDGNGCVNSAVATVTINPLPTITVNSPATCAGSTTTVTASGANTYTWSTGQTGSSAAVPGTAASYTVTGTDANGCSNTAVTTVSILPLPVPQTVLGNSVICNGQTDILSVASSTYSYTWSGPGGSLGNGTSVSVTQAGVYTLTTSNSCGSVSTQFTVNISSPTAAFAPNALAGQAPATFTFTNSSNGSNLSNYWNFANGDTSTTLNPAETYTAAGAYTVSLAVTDMYGCMDSTRVTVYVTDTTPPIIIPNIFSPNGDSINDVFAVKANGIRSFNCKVYDRWGLALFEWNDVNKGWDGKNSANGSPVSDGTYYYLITYVTVIGDVGIKPGFIQLVR